jgi:DNA-binding NarL/FixJ family response regulator
MTASRAALVGRENEQEVAGQLLEEVMAGAPRMAFVVGEPGIGKTSLLDGLAGQAEQRGCLALRGSAAEFEQELPFGLIVDALDEYLGSLEPRAFSRLAAEDLSEIAGVFPALRSLERTSPGPTTAAERFRAHHAVRDLIQRLAGPQPLVLVLEDLHWADGASIELVSHLLRRPPQAPVLVAGSFRTGQADRGLETAIAAAGANGGAVRRVDLGPLAPSAAGELVDAVGAAELEQLYRASGGNPFYLLQLARGGGHHGARRGGEVPPAVVAAIVAELDGLSAAARRFAEAAAVAGDPFELDLAVATAGVDDGYALDAMDELAARDLVRAGEVPRRFGFRHPLVRSAVYESTAAGARLAAHGRAARALADRGAPASARAHHVAQSASHGDLGAVAVLREAGEGAAQRAPASAAQWFEIALGLLPASAPAGERVELLMALAGAKAATGRFEEARAALLESIELTPGDSEALRITLIGACAGVEQLLGHHREAHDRLTTALDRLPEATSVQAVELLLHLATGHFYRQDYPAMGTAAERALGAAEALGNAPLIAASTAAMTGALAFVGGDPEAATRCDEAAALVDAMSDEELALRLDSLANLSAGELYLDRFVDAGRHAERGLAVAQATGQTEISPFLIPVLGTVLQMLGSLDEAVRVLDGASEAARLSGNVQALAWNLLNHANASLYVGDLETAGRAAQESVDITRDLDHSLVSTYAGANQCFVLNALGEHERAIAAVTESAGGEDLPLVPGGWRANYFEAITRSRLALGDGEGARRAAAGAAEVAERTGTTFSRAMAARAAAAVALDAGDPERGAEQALLAAANCDAIESRVEASISRTLAGRALGAAGRQDEAIAVLERAAGELEGYGAVRHRQAAEHELRKLGRRVHRRSAPGRADGARLETLTEREAEIAALVTDRRTNPEIAAELFLSVKTIETHMRNIFRKLDVTSRVEVARVMERERG